MREIDGPMKPNFTFLAHDSHITSLKFTSDGRRLFSAGMDNVVKLWSAEDLSLLRTFSGHNKSVNCLALTPDEATLITGSSDATVRIWDVATAEQRVTLQDRKRVVADLSLSLDGEWVAAGSYKGRVAIWTIKGEPIAAFPASKQNVASVALSPVDRTLLATSGLGPDIKIWSLPEGRGLTTLTLPAVAVMQVRFTPDGRHLIALTYEGALHAWRTRDWTATETPTLTIPGARLFALDGPGERCAILSEGHVQIRTVPEWKVLQAFPVDARVLSAAAFSPSGQMLVVGAADRRIRVWRLDESSLP
jgi:WD40 repeat protein